MRDRLERAARERPGHPAVIASGQAISYGELDAEATRLARDIERGALVPIDLPPGIEFVARLHAAWKADAVALPLAPGTTPPALHPPEAAALVILTSGTTGQPKPVALTHGNLDASARASASAFPLGPEDRWLCPLPLDRIGGLQVPVRCALAGATTVIHERFDAERVRAAFEAGEATFASLVPTMLVRLREAGLSEAPGLRAIALGGGPIPPGLLEWAAETGIPAVPVYGMTETASQITAGSPGRPLEGVELRIGEGGEVLVRGPVVAPAEIAGDGWLHTGDQGRLESGLLHLEGRIKDLIVTGGVNVAPLAVEHALIAHPGVADAGVTGLPDPVWGEAVTAFVVPRGSALPPDDELRAWCRERLPAAAVPKAFHAVTELPRGEGGKLARQLLRV